MTLYHLHICRPQPWHFITKTLVCIYVNGKGSSNWLWSTWIRPVVSLNLSIILINVRASALLLILSSVMVEVIPLLATPSQVLTNCNLILWFQSCHIWFQSCQSWFHSCHSWSQSCHCWSQSCHCWSQSCHFDFKAANWFQSYQKYLFHSYQSWFHSCQLIPKTAIVDPKAAIWFQSCQLIPKLPLLIPKLPLLIPKLPLLISKLPFDFKAASWFQSYQKFLFHSYQSWFHSCQLIPKLPLLIPKLPQLIPKLTVDFRPVKVDSKTATVDSMSKVYSKAATVGSKAESCC